MDLLLLWQLPNVNVNDNNAIITEIESKIPSITGLATDTALNIKKYLMFVIYFKKKTNYDAKNIRYWI